MIRDITGDGVLTPDEFERLLLWLDDHSRLLTRWPFSEVTDRVADILEDNIATGDELASLCVFLDALLNRRPPPPVAEGIFTADADAIEIPSKTFVFTGDMEAMDRRQAMEMAESLGAKVAKTVTRKTDFVVVGLKGSSAWKGDGWGGKIEQARSNREKGCPVQIVSETDFLRAAAG